MENRLRELLAGEFGSQADNVAEFLCRPEVVQQMHLAIENLLIEFRDSGIFVIHPANGFTVKSVEGGGGRTPSCESAPGLVSSTS
jgi:hypothetical protein